jgi:putative oxidoreductase
MQKALWSDIGLLLIRLVLAAVFIYHGAGKLFGVFGGNGIRATAAFFDGLGIPMPTAAAWLQGILEFFGGILIGLGVLTRIVCIPLSLSMFVAVFVAHWGKWDVRAGGMEFALTLAVVLLSLAMIGPGRFALLKLRAPKTRG